MISALALVLMSPQAEPVPTEQPRVSVIAEMFGGQRQMRTADWGDVARQASGGMTIGVGGASPFFLIAGAAYSEDSHSDATASVQASVVELVFGARVSLATRYTYVAFDGGFANVSARSSYRLLEDDTGASLRAHGNGYFMGAAAGYESSSGFQVGAFVRRTWADVETGPPRLELDAGGITAGLTLGGVFRTKR